MRRSCKLTIQFATHNKLNIINTLLQSYRAAVNFYIKYLWSTKGKLDYKTANLLQHSRLSERYKCQALKQALNIVISTKKSAKERGIPCSMPVFKGAAILDAKFVSIEEGKGSFDLVVKLSTLKKYKRIIIPTKKNKQLNKWLNKPQAKLIQGCCLSENNLIVWVELPDLPNKTKGKTVGFDIGANKLITDSNSNMYGTNFKKLSLKIRRKQRNSKAYKRSLKERDQYINKVVKDMPWNEFKTIGIENLKNVKKGKSKKRSKSFRKAMIPWTYRQVVNRIECLSQENRVRLVKVDPAYTSRICPSCGMESKNNRKGESFKCVYCNYSNDSDIVGALNVLGRTLGLIGRVKSPMPIKVI